LLICACKNGVNSQRLRAMKSLSRVPLTFLSSAFGLLLLCSGCSTSWTSLNKLPGNRAFIQYWPGELNTPALRVAIKDNIDMKGVVSTAGSELFKNTHKPAEEDATVLPI